MADLSVTRWHQAITNSGRIRCFYRSATVTTCPTNVTYRYRYFFVSPVYPVVASAQTEVSDANSAHTPCTRRLRVRAGRDHFTDFRNRGRPGGRSNTGRRNQSNSDQYRPGENGFHRPGWRLCADQSADWPLPAPD